MALLWALKRVDSPLLGISKVERIQEFVDALKQSLTDEEDRYLSELYEPHRSNSNIY